MARPMTRPMSRVSSSGAGARVGAGEGRVTKPPLGSTTNVTPVMTLGAMASETDVGAVSPAPVKALRNSVFAAVPLDTTWLACCMSAVVLLLFATSW